MRNTAANFTRFWLLAALVVALVFGLFAPDAAAVNDADLGQNWEKSGSVDSPSGAAEELKSSGPPNAVALIARTALALGAVLFLMWAVVWLGRKFFPRTARAWSGGPIEILNTRSLGARRNLMLVRVKGRTLLLGVTPQSIQFLSEIEEEDPGDWTAAATESGLPIPQSKSAAERSNAGTTHLGAIDS